VDRGIQFTGNGASRVYNEVFEDGNGGGGNVANVGVIVGEGGTALRVSGLYVEGCVYRVDGSVNGSVISNVTIAGDVDTIFVTNGATNVDIRGEAYLIDGGISLVNINVNGEADTIKATRTVTRVHVLGDVEYLISGGVLSLAFVDGDVFQVSASNITDVQIAGDVGDVFGGEINGEYIQYYDGFDFHGATAIDSDGGIAADVIRRMSVAGWVSNLVANRYTADAVPLWGQTVDNGLVGTIARRRPVVSTLIKLEGRPINELPNVKAFVLGIDNSLLDFFQGLVNQD
jgi:hypothetical protein